MDFNKFVDAYIQTALWCENIKREDISYYDEYKSKVARDCKKFIRSVVADFGRDVAIEILEAESDGYLLAPHDFFLTRNGHGSGFRSNEDIYGDDVVKGLIQIAKYMGPDEYLYEYAVLGEGKEFKNKNIEKDSGIKTQNLELKKKERKANKYKNYQTEKLNRLITLVECYTGKKVVLI